ncbi:uncharacterized protein ARMOST_21322 [Armillaria ostoyae]|uniref:Uncharacterized protein n=1 Tax=Armillaria ostoyae TaxID=47428 RepID=A0A284S9T1_ARMOS|nr:uncharacterized protein ARMOST_21322 [Armillaria ostoyae]
MSSNVKFFEAVHPADAVTDAGMPAFQLSRATRHDDVQAEMKKIQLQIIPLEQLERKLATQYGMVQDFDSVEVFGQAKKLAFANPDHDFVGNLQDLDRLNDLRLRLTELRHSHTVSPPADANVAPLLTENCSTCGLPGRLNLKHDNKRVLGILRAEQPIIEYDHDWVHQNIATLDGHLLSLRQSLSRLESLTALIKTQIDTTSTEKEQLESISAPIRRLPRDILLEIFSLSFRQEDTTSYPWTLGHVCHWWRDIVHSSLTLWSVVVLYPPYNPKIVETLLQRSANVPLSVYISTQHYGSVHNLTIFDRVMSLCHRWSTLELHAHGPMFERKLPSFFPQLRTLKVRGPWSSCMVPVLDAPLLKTVRLVDFPLQSVPDHITHLALSKLSIEELPMLSSFLNLVELHFKAKYFTRDVAPTSTITHPTIRCLSVSGTISLLGDRHNVICQELSSPDFLPNLEHLTMTWISKEFCVAAEMIRARWYTPMRRIRTFVVIRNVSEPKNVNVDAMQGMKDEGLDFKIVEDQHGKEFWLDLLMTETEDVW